MYLALTPPLSLYPAPKAWALNTYPMVLEYLSSHEVIVNFKGNIIHVQ